MSKEEVFTPTTVSKKNLDPFHNAISNQVCDFKPSSAFHLASLYYTYVQTHCKDGLDRETHLQNIKCMSTMNISKPDKYKDVIRIFLDQANNYYHVLCVEEDPLDFAKWCLSKRVMDITTMYGKEKVFSDTEYNALVLSYLFIVGKYSNTIMSVSQQLLDIAQNTNDDLLVLTADTMLDAEQDNIYQRKVVVIIAQLVIICKHKLYIDQSFIERYMFKKLMDVIRMYRLTIAYDATILLTLFVRQYVSDFVTLERLLQIKVNMFFADREVVQLAFTLCDKPMGVAEWAERMRRITPL